MIHYLPSPAMTERIRTTISLTPESYEVFKRMADAGNVSVSRCMGDWLHDTTDAAEMITLKMEEAKRAPMRVVREMRAMVAGMANAFDIADAQVRGRSRSDSERQPPRAGGAGAPPSSNTGVLVPSPPSTVRRVKRTVKGKAA
jgi:hypothetical protein